jgi:hypothetical protein
MKLAGFGCAASCLLLLSGPGTAFAQDQRANARITEAECRNRAQTDEQIVVCGKRNAEDPYRIPKAFRKPPPGTRTGTSLAVEVMGSGIPGAGSNIGGAGSMGSSKQLYEQWLAEKNAAKKAAEAEPR